jgi:hypothetical protein
MLRHTLQTNGRARVSILWVKMMSKRLITALIALSLICPGRAGAQAAPDPDTIAAAKELIIASRAMDQFKLMLPRMAQAMKPAVLSGRPQMEGDFDVIIAVLLKGMSTRIDDLMDQIALVYARHFTGDELRQLATFYRTPVGQKFLQTQPALMQEGGTIGQNWGRTIGGEMQSQINEELRKRAVKP